MSARALYRVMVRMLYDHALVRAVCATPSAGRASAGAGPGAWPPASDPLSGVDLTPAEVDWLRASDPRAWRTDPLRRARSLTGLVEEFPLASAFVLRRAREGVMRLETPLLDAFFSHRTFHDCIQSGGSMVFAYASYLQEPEHGAVAADPRIAPLARLEEGIARLRRVPEGATRRGPASSSARLQTAPWVVIVPAPAATSELHARVSKALSVRDAKPLASALDPRWSLPVLLDLEFDRPETILLERPPVPGVPWSEAPVLQSAVTPELAGVIAAASSPRAPEEIRAVIRELGAEPGEDQEILGSLTEQGFLVATE